MNEHTSAVLHLDIERLATVDVTTDLPRRKGRTLAFQMLMLGEVWLGDENNRYLYVGETLQHAKMVCVECAEMVARDGMYQPTVVIASRVVRVGGKEFHFMSPINLEPKGRLEWDRIFVDVNGELEKQVRRALSPKCNTHADTFR